MGHITLSIDRWGGHRPIDEIKEEHHDDSVPQSWKCCSKCKPLTDKEIAVISEHSSTLYVGMAHAAPPTNIHFHGFFY